MISDNELYSLAVFLGCSAMILIVIYHFLTVNADFAKADEKPAKSTPQAQASGKATASR